MSKEHIIEVLKNKSAEEVKDFIISAIQDLSSDIVEGCDNGYDDGETILDDYFVTVMLPLGKLK